MKKILITGATGFIGSNLCRRLVKEGHEVHIFSRFGTGFWRIKDLADKIKIWGVDLTDKYSVQKSINKINPQIIYHFAANEASPLRENANKDILINIIGTWNLLQSLSNCNYELFLNAGSSSEYGFKDCSMRENDLLEPNSFHSFGKCSQTLLCQTCAVVDKKPIVNLRLFSVYGPYERKTRLIPMVINNTLNDIPLNLSHPEVVRDFIYVDDVVDLCVDYKRFLPFSGEIFNIGTGIQSTIKEVVDTVFDLTGKFVGCNWQKNNRIWDTNKWVANTFKSSRDLKFVHSTNLRDGLRKTIEWTKK